MVALTDIASIASIRNEVEDNLGKKVILKANKGRKRIIENEGLLEEAYPNVFTVRINMNSDNARTVSYSYSDILTSTVKVKFC